MHSAYIEKNGSTRNANNHGQILKIAFANAVGLCRCCACYSCDATPLSSSGSDDPGLLVHEGLYALEIWVK